MVLVGGSDAGMQVGVRGHSTHGYSSGPQLEFVNQVFILCECISTGNSSLSTCRPWSCI